MAAMMMVRNGTATGAPLTLVGVHATSNQASGISLTDAIAAVRRVEEHTMKQTKMMSRLGGKNLDREVEARRTVLTLAE